MNSLISKRFIFFYLIDKNNLLHILSNTVGIKCENKRS